ncbi:MAG: flagellin [Pseudomonadota bacterium]|nr:flagellin [Pseudomonadota bacterium]
MAINVRTNTASLNALKDLNRTTRALSRSFERISSGKRISRAADDAAGVGVAENLRAAHTSAAVAARNTNDGVSIIAIAEGASAEVGNILIRMRELAVQGASETLDDDERAYVQQEYSSLAGEVERIASVTEFNGQSLTDGSIATIGVQVGIHNTVNDQIDITLGDLSATTLGVDATAIDMSTAAGASASLTAIDLAIDTVSSYRSGYGAVENRLGNALNNLETFEQTTLEAESRIRDADFGKETATLAQNQVLQQAGVSVLTQAKGINQAALSLLQG